MVVVGAVAHDDVGFPFADKPCQRLAIFQGRHEFSVMVVHHVRLNTENLGSLLDFAGSPLGQLPAGHDRMANVAVGSGDEFHLVPQLGPHGSDPTSLEFAVVGMRAKDDDTQLAVVGIGGEQAAEESCCQKCETVSSDEVFLHGSDW